MSSIKTYFTTSPAKDCVKALLLSVLLPVSAAHAVPFSSDISITGEILFDECLPNCFTDNNTAGNFAITAGGHSTRSSFSDGSAFPANPLSGSLTDLGDGVNIFGDARGGNFPAALDVGIHAGITVANRSLTDSYEVVLGFSADHFVDAEGHPDAFVDSTITLDVDGSEVYYSRLISDTFNGDRVRKRGLGGELDVRLGPGGGVRDDFISILLPAITLAASSTAVLELDWMVEGFGFSELNVLQASTVLDVLSVTNLAPPPTQSPGVVPEPGTLLLLMAGFLGMPMVRNNLSKI